MSQKSTELQTFKKVTHVLFDMDGLLLDTERIYSETTQKIINPYGKQLTWELNSQLMGLQVEDEAKKVVDTLKLPITYQEYLDLQTEENAVAMLNCNLLPGAEQLVRHLHANNIPIALATSSGSDSVEVKTQKHKALFDLFNHKVMGSSDPDVKVGKPAPDIFLVCASRFPDKPNPEQCLVFEDAPNGVRAAVDAGMQVVMVPDVNVTEKERSLATLVLSSLELTPLEAFGLPPLAN